MSGLFRTTGAGASAMIVHLEVSRFTLVPFVLTITGEQLQIIRAVVCYVVVNMMHDFGAQERTPKRLSNDKPMFHHVTVFAGHADVLRWAAHILDTRRVTALALAVGCAAFPSGIVRAAHRIAGALTTFWCGHKLGLRFALPVLRAPFIAARIRAKVQTLAFAFPAFVLEKHLAAVVTDRIRGVLTHSPIIAQAGI